MDLSIGAEIAVPWIGWDENTGHVEETMTVFCGGPQGGDINRNMTAAVDDERNVRRLAIARSSAHRSGTLLAAQPIGIIADGEGVRDPDNIVAVLPQLTQPAAYLSVQTRVSLLLLLDTNINMASFAPPPPPPPPPLSVRIADPTITCVCPPGTPRLAKDLAFHGDTQELGISWVHLPCKPYDVLGGMEMTSAPRGALTGFLGPNPSPKMLTMVKNFTSKFICDGPCEDGDRKLADYFTCKRCLTWQHRGCMLYGEKGDCGGPVCNHCYMDFLAHHDEVRQWQRWRLLEALQEAIMFVTDELTSHEVWRRAWLKKFLRRFFHTNQGLFVRFVLQRRSARVLAGLHPRITPERQHIKEEPKDDDDLAILAAAWEDMCWANSNIVVSRPGTKIATRQPRFSERRLNRKPSPVRPDGTKRSHKRRRPPTPEFLPGIKVFGPGAPGAKRAGVDPNKRHKTPPPVTMQMNSDGDYTSTEQKTPKPRKSRKRKRIVTPSTDSEEEDEAPPSPVLKGRRKKKQKSSAAAKAQGSRKRKRTANPPSDSEEEDVAPPSPVLKGTKKNYMVGVGTARKSINMAEAMKKFAYTSPNEDDEGNSQSADDEYDDDDGREDKDDEETPDVKPTKTLESEVESNNDDENANTSRQMAHIKRRVGKSAKSAPAKKKEKEKKKKKVSCKCKNGPLTSGGSFVCSECETRQHRACAAPGQNGLHPMCNICLASPTANPFSAPVVQSQVQSGPPNTPSSAAPLSGIAPPAEGPPVAGPSKPRPVNAGPSAAGPPASRPLGRRVPARIPTGRRPSGTRPPATAPPATAPPATAPPATTPPAAGTLAARAVAAGQTIRDVMLEEIDSLSTTVLWREYLSLPSPYGGGANTAAPPKAPPPDWLEECKFRLTRLLVAAGRDQTNAFLEPVLMALPRLDDPILKALTDLAHWMVRKGPWSGKRAELGLLGEILSLDDKGRHWRGGGFRK